MSSTKSSTAAVKKPVAKATPATPKKVAPTAEKAAATPVSSTSTAAKAKPVPRKKAAEETVAKAENEEKDVAKEESTSSTEESTETTDAPTEPTVETISIEKQIDDLIARKEADRQRLKEEVVLLRAMKKNYARQLKDMKKTKKRRDTTRVGGAPRNPSGFAQESRIRDPLCDFLKLEHGTKIARTDVTKKVIEYIKANNLEKGGNRRNIEPDEPLIRLVGDADERRQTMENRKKIKPKTVVTDELSYFNLQVHLNKHFINEAAERRFAEEAVAAEAAASASA